jgi:excisionase family DNA binding protein
MNSSTHSKALAGSTKYCSADDFLRANQGVIGRTLLYEAIRRGELPHIRIGRRILIPDNALDLMLEAKRRDSDA